MTHAVPIYEGTERLNEHSSIPIVDRLGFAMPHSILRNDVAGRDVTRFLKLLLRKEGFTFKTTAEFEIVKSIKERACFVTPTAQKEEINNNEKSQFTLPDGSVIEVKEKRTEEMRRLNDHLAWTKSIARSGSAVQSGIDRRRERRDS